MLFFAIGAVVEGAPTTSHTPLSGHFSLVRAVVPIGDFVFVFMRFWSFGAEVRSQDHWLSCVPNLDKDFCCPENRSW